MVNIPYNKGNLDPRSEHKKIYLQNFKPKKKFDSRSLIISEKYFTVKPEESVGDITKIMSFTLEKDTPYILLKFLLRIKFLFGKQLIKNYKFDNLFP